MSIAVRLQYGECGAIAQRFLRPGADEEFGQERHDSFLPHNPPCPKVRAILFIVQCSMRMGAMHSRLGFSGTETRLANSSHSRLPAKRMLILRAYRGAAEKGSAISEWRRL